MEGNVIVIVYGFFIFTLPGLAVLADEMQENVLDESFINEVESDTNQVITREFNKGNSTENVEGKENEERYVEESEGNLIDVDPEDSGERLSDYASEDGVEINIASEKLYDLTDVDNGTIEESEPETVIGLESVPSLNGWYEVGEWTVGDDVTAKVISSGEVRELYFYSNNGVLWSTWKNIIGCDLEQVQFIALDGGAYGQKMYFPEDSRSLFSGLSNLKEIDFRGIDTSIVTNMSWMFSGCSGLTKISMDGFDTSNVTKMGTMFDGCSSLTELDMRSFNTSNVTDMGAMFRDCASLKKLDLSYFDTVNVKYMEAMFYNCMGLTELDLHSFNTKNVKAMDEMFRGCSGISALELSNFDTSNVTNMYGMFSGCSSITALDLSSFHTSNVNNMRVMFNECKGLRNLNVSSFDTSNVTSMDFMFFGCSGLTNLNISNFETSNVTNTYCMFKGCSGLKNLDLSSFDTSNVTDMSCMFDGCSSLENLDLSSFDTSDVIEMKFMLSGCNALKLIKTPKHNLLSGIVLPSTMIDEAGNTYNELPVRLNSIILVVGIDISSLSIELSATKYTYDGKAKKPSVTVTDGTNILVKNKDYSVSYSNNINAGTATVTVKGIDFYAGSVNKTFTIAKATPVLKFASLSVTKEISDPSFTNPLTKTTDGTVSFKSENESVATVNAAGKVTIHGVGETTITATAKAGANYKSGRASYTLTVVDSRIDISVCTISLSQTRYINDGKEKKPTITVKDGTKKLALDTDFFVTYKNNINLGTATEEITGIGQYKGSVNKSFSIVRGYNVSYNANGGTGTPSSQKKMEKVALTLSSIKPTKQYLIIYNSNGGSVSPSSKNINCIFNGWNTEKNGTGSASS